MDLDMDLTEDEAVPVPRDDLANKMDNMMAMLLGLTQKVNAHGKHHLARAASPIGSPSTSQDALRQMRCLASPNCQLDVLESVRRVEQCLHQLMLQADASSDDKVSSDEDQPATCTR